MTFFVLSCFVKILLILNQIYFFSINALERRFHFSIKKMAHNTKKMLSTILRRDFFVFRVFVFVMHGVSTLYSKKIFSVISLKYHGK